MGANLPEQFDQGQRRRLHRDLEQMRAALQAILNGENIQTGPGVFKRVHNGKVVLSARGGGGRVSLGDWVLPFELTRRRPRGYLAAVPSQAHVWLTMGTVNSRIPDDIKDPILLPENAIDRWVWLQINLDLVEPTYAASVVNVTIEQGEELPEPPGPDEETGDPPDHIILPCGIVTTEGGELTHVFPTGVGSAWVYSYFTQARVVASTASAPGGLRAAINFGVHRL